MARIVVLGAGVSGLSCAVRLLERGHEVEVWAQAFSPHATSDVAAALWWPFHAEPADKVTAWSMTSFHTFRELSRDRNKRSGDAQRQVHFSELVPTGLG